MNNKINFISPIVVKVFLIMLTFNVAGEFILYLFGYIEKKYFLIQLYENLQNTSTSEHIKALAADAYKIQASKKDTIEMVKMLSITIRFFIKIIILYFCAFYLTKNYLRIEK